MTGIYDPVVRKAAGIGWEWRVDVWFRLDNRRDGWAFTRRAALRRARRRAAALEHARSVNWTATS